MGHYEELEDTLRNKPKVWLVTGAAGFIGSHLVERLLNLGQQVRGLDNLVTGRQSNIDYLNSLENSKNFNFIKADICNLASCEEAIDGVNVVLHQAALGSVPRSIKEPLASHASNVDGFLNVLKTATAKKVERLVYASSSSVYGDSEGLPKKEGGEGKVLSPYAATKLIDEIYADVFKRVYNTPVVGLRYFNVFGARQDPNGPYAAVIPLWISSMLSGKPVYINGDGSYSRDFCYIENVIRANLLAGTCEDRALGKAYNIALGDQTTLLQLFDYIRSGLSEVLPDLEVADAEHREFRDGDIPHSLADVSQAKGFLHYEPKVTIKDGLLETLKAYLEDEEKA